MGVINVTPDSFSDGGRCLDLEAAVARARLLATQGAAILDVGAESTRPGAGAVPEDVELARLIPVLRALRDRVGLPLSVDTRKSAVFCEAYRAGASMLNDVSAFRFDPAMAPAVAATDAAVILMHSRGVPGDMDSHARYADPVSEVHGELAAARDAAVAAGVAEELILLDPGLGFAKDADQCWTLLRAIARFRTLGRPLVVGPSRKRFLAAAAGDARPEDRDAATAAVAAWLSLNGVDVIRVHAVAPSAAAAAVGAALRREA
jgi:dihydropteroate synthase